MTLIASTFTSDIPVLIGDILISDSIGTINMNVPTVSDNVMDYLKAGNEFYPIKLNQKLYILKENICIGIAGSIFEAKLFLEDLQIFCSSHGSLNMLSVSNFVEDYLDALDARGFSFMLLVVEMEEGGYVTKMISPDDPAIAETLNYGKAHAIGSGADDFLNSLGGTYSSNVKIDRQSLNFALQQNILLLTTLLTIERQTLGTVNKHWGAGFEMIFLDGGNFTKLTEFGFILNQDDVVVDGYLHVPVPSVIMYYKYENENLYITALHAIKGQTTLLEDYYIIEYESFKEVVFVVEPLIKSQSRDLDRPFNSSFISPRNSMGYIFKKDGKIFFPSTFNLDHRIIVEYVQSKSLKLKIRRDLNDGMLETLNKMIR